MLYNFSLLRSNRSPCSIATSLAACSFLSISSPPQIGLDGLFSRPSSNGYATYPSKWLLVRGPDGIGTTSSRVLFLRLLLICSTRESVSSIAWLWPLICWTLPELLYLQGMYAWSINAWSCQTCQSGQPWDRFNFWTCLYLNLLIDVNWSKH